MRFSRIRAHDHDELGLVEIGNRVGRRRRAERLHHAGHRRAMTHTGAIVDMVGADDAPHELAKR